MEFKQIEYINRETDKIEIEKVPGENFLKFLYYNPFGKLSLEAVVKRKFLSRWYGKKMDSPKSCEIIENFARENGIDLNEAEKNLNEFTSFNDFFIRKLKEGARKIDFEESTLVSPADGKVLVIENIHDSSKFFLKGEEFTLGDFFKNEVLAEKYLGGIMVIVRLAPADYHRFHFPADGKISMSRKIEGYYYSVSPHAIRQNFRIFCENKREYSILSTEKFGDICIAEIGATMVGGIKQTYEPDTFVKKGDEKGYFYFGGSTVIMFLEKDRVEIDRDILENSINGIETKVFMGEGIGKKF